MTQTTKHESQLYQSHDQLFHFLMEGMSSLTGSVGGISEDIKNLDARLLEYLNELKKMESRVDILDVRLAKMTTAIRITSSLLMLIGGALVASLMDKIMAKF